MGESCVDPQYSDVLYSGQCDFSQRPSNLNPAQFDPHKIDFRAGGCLCDQEVAQAKPDFEFKRRAATENATPSQRPVKLLPGHEGFEGAVEWLHF
jgi:hypothetical protein